MVELATDIEVPFVLITGTGAGLVVIMESVLLLINSCDILFTFQQFFLFIFVAVVCCVWIVGGDLWLSPSLSIAGLLGQTLHLQVLGGGQEGGEILLSNVDLSCKYKVIGPLETNFNLKLKVQQTPSLTLDLEPGNKFLCFYKNWSNLENFENK